MEKIKSLLFVTLAFLLFDSAVAQEASMKKIFKYSLGKEHIIKSLGAMCIAVCLQRLFVTTTRIQQKNRLRWEVYSSAHKNLAVCCCKNGDDLDSQEFQDELKKSAIEACRKNFGDTYAEKICEFMNKSYDEREQMLKKLDQGQREMLFSFAKNALRIGILGAGLVSLYESPVVFAGLLSLCIGVGVLIYGFPLP